MHGLVELVVVIGFVATFIVSFSAHRLGRPRSYPVLILVALWPLLLIVFSERTEAMGWLSWSFLALLGLMIVATFLGAGSSALLLRWRRRH